MARPAKAVSTKTGTITKEEEAIRKDTEQRLKGKSHRLTPPKYLTDDQKKIFRYIIKELKEADILGNLDVYVLTTTAISIDRLAKMEQQINDNEHLLLDTHFMTAKDKYTKDFFRCCNELSLSPQARAKLSISNVNAMKESKNPLLDALDL